MHVKLLRIKGTWRDVADSANTTVHRNEGTREPSAKWKKRILLSEHSMIRQIHIMCKWYELPYWVSVHLVRHKFGIEHWVRTQRTDRTNTNRNELSQGALVEHEFEANMQAFIFISRKRLCAGAAKETREAWQAVLKTIKNKEPELYEVCVPDCVYRGRCYEMNCCGYDKTEKFKEQLAKYGSL